MMLRTKLDALFEEFADTELGSQIFKFLSDAAFGLAEIFRRPVGFRRVFDRIFQRPITSTVQFLKNLFRKNLRLKIAEG
jgi:hypothetical protein